MRKAIHAISLVLLAGLAVLSAASSEEAEVMAAMNVYKNALIQKDGAALNRILSPDLLYTHSGGQFETKKDVVASITGGKTTIQKVEFSDTTVHLYGNTALVKTRVDLWHSDKDIVHMSVLHVWVKGPSGWQMVARQATKLPA
jgi:ketosteroid isomerase-like protein